MTGWTPNDVSAALAGNVALRTLAQQMRELVTHPDDFFMTSHHLLLSHADTLAAIAQAMKRESAV